MEKRKKLIDKFGIFDNSLVSYGEDIYKIDPKFYNEFKPKGKLILMTSINPTKFGEGKTTCAIGLADGLTKLKYNTMLALREPSMGPVFGSKGTATGGGECLILPEDKINLHFTGDLHAITAANNLISAVIDSSIYWGNKLDINLDTINWARCLDVNDRALRNVTIKINKKYERQESFAITAASKMMTIISLANDAIDLRNRLENTIFAYNNEKKPLYLKKLNVVGSVMTILNEALKPNVVFTKYETPSLVHCGPFANIATGTNSVIATKLSLKLADYVVTESGFSSELGFEKYADVVTVQNDFKPSCVVIVVSVRALKEKKDYLNDFKQLQYHISNVQKVTSNFLIVINKFLDDDAESLKKLEDFLKNSKYNFAWNESYTKGPDGAIEFAKAVVKIADRAIDFTSFVNKEIGVKNKIEAIVKNFYHLPEIFFSQKALDKIAEIKKLDKNIEKEWPIVVAKSQTTIDGNDKYDENYKMEITNVELNSGARFILALTNKILMMPGLPEDGNFINIDVIDGIVKNMK